MELFYGVPLGGPDETVTWPVLPSRLIRVCNVVVDLCDVLSRDPSAVPSLLVCCVLDLHPLCVVPVSPELPSVATTYFVMVTVSATVKLTMARAVDSA